AVLVRDQPVPGVEHERFAVIVGRRVPVVVERQGARAHGRHLVLLVVRAVHRCPAIGGRAAEVAGGVDLAAKIGGHSGASQQVQVMAESFQQPGQPWSSPSRSMCRTCCSLRPYRAAMCCCDCTVSMSWSWASTKAKNTSLRCSSDSDLS